MRKDSDGASFMWVFATRYHKSLLLEVIRQALHLLLVKPNYALTTPETHGTTIGTFAWEFL